MNKKILIPSLLGIILLIAIISLFIGEGRKIKLEYESVQESSSIPDSIDLKVYVENSGSMDAYMCLKSNLKDAVFDYVSDVSKYTTTCSLNYINSQIIPFKGNLDLYIKNLTPQSFAMAGGNRSNTDLRKMLEDITKINDRNTVSIFVSDCILDIQQNAVDFFGNCQVSVKNTFNEALKNNPNFSVQIIKLQSKFDGYWYCGRNRERLTNVVRPYYIWVIGDKNILAMINKNAPVDNIIGGIKEYCAYSPSQSIAFDVDKKTYVVNHTGKINIELLADLTTSLQSESVIKNTSQYSSSNPNQVLVTSVQNITAKGSKFSHVINVEISKPETLKSETLTFSYPYLATWIDSSNDETGINVNENLDKTTGIKYLIKGVAEAYKNSTNFGSITYKLKNK